MQKKSKDIQRKREVDKQKGKDNGRNKNTVRQGQRQNIGYI